MARFLLAWELGGGLGHLVPLARLAEALLHRGHTVDLVLKDLSLAHEVLGPWADSASLRLWQAPCWLPAPDGFGEPATHADLLLRAGFVDGASLSGLVRAWRQLYATCRPEVLVADHAPTALLAARGQGMRRSLFGNGFFVPPPGRPMPAFRDWEEVSPARIEAAESRVLAACNDSLAQCGAAPIDALSMLFDVDEVFLLGWAELDHLGPWRGPAPPPSWGPMLLPGADGADWPWPENEGPRVVAYLQAAHPAVEAVLQTLKEGPWQAVMYLAGVSHGHAMDLGGARLHVVARPIDLRAALVRADLMLVGGTGTAYQALAQGVPTVLLPMHAEQLLFARRVVATGAGVMLWPGEVAAGLGRALRAVGNSLGFRRAAQALAARHPGEALPAIVARCEALAGLSGSAR